MVKQLLVEIQFGQQHLKSRALLWIVASFDQRTVIAHCLILALQPYHAGTQSPECVIFNTGCWISVKQCLHIYDRSFISDACDRRISADII